MRTDATPTPKLVLISLAAVIVVTLAFTVFSLFLAPAPLSVSADGISADASRTRLPLAGNCFDLSWQAADGVTLDGEPVESAGTRTLCTWRDHTYTLTAVGQSLSVPITIVSAAPTFWIVAVTPLFALAALALLSFPRLFAPPADSAARPPVNLTPVEVVIVGAVFFGLVIALWLPFGLGGNATVDNWEYRSWFETPGAFPVLSAPVSPHRPLAYLSDGLNYLVTPDSFIGLNVLLIGYLGVKALLAYTLLRRLMPAHRMLAFAVALVFLLHPVDPFYMGGISVQLTLVVILIAAHLLLSFWRQPSLITFGAAQLFALIAVAIYEVPIPLMMALPVMLLLDAPRLSRRWLAVAALWALVPAAWGAYFVVWYVTAPSPYFARAANDVPTGGFSTAHAMLQVYLRSLVSLYDDVARSVWAALRGRDLLSLGLGAGGALLTFALLWRAGQPSSRLSLRRAAALIAGGLAIIFLGMVVYVPSALFAAYAFFLTHPYFIINLGAALVTGTVIALLPRRFLQVGALALFVGAMIPYLIAQHGTAQDNAGYTSRVLTPIVRLVPSFQPGTHVLILDEDQRVTQFLFQYVLEAGMQTVYGQGDLRARHCSTRVDADVTERIDTNMQAWCEFTPDGVNVKGYDEFRDVPAYLYYRGEREVWDYARLVVIQVTEDGIGVLPELPPAWGVSSDAYRPLERVTFDAPTPRRYQTMIEACNCLPSS